MASKYSYNVIHCCMNTVTLLYMAHEYMTTATLLYMVRGQPNGEAEVLLGVLLHVLPHARDAAEQVPGPRPGTRWRKCFQHRVLAQSCVLEYAAITMLLEV